MNCGRLSSFRPTSDGRPLYRRPVAAQSGFLSPLGFSGPPRLLFRRCESPLPGRRHFPTAMWGLFVCRRLRRNCGGRAPLFVGPIIARYRAISVCPSGSAELQSRCGRGVDRHQRWQRKVYEPGNYLLTPLLVAKPLLNALRTRPAP